MRLTLKVPLFAMLLAVGVAVILHRPEQAMAATVTVLQDSAQSADSAAAYNVPDWVPSTHPVAFFWASVVGVLGSLLSEGFQLISNKLKGLGVWPKRFATAGLTYGLALGFRYLKVDLPTDPASLVGALSWVLAGGLTSFGAHQLLFAKKK